MTSASTAENPFQLISDQFDRAYSFGSEPIKVSSLGQAEFISGVQSDGGELGIFRPSIDVMGGDLNIFRVFVWPAVSGEEPAPENGGEGIDEEDFLADDSQEVYGQFLVGGTELEPVGFEVITDDPMMTRELEPHEMADLAQRISGTTFR